MIQPRCAVLLLNWNGWQDTVECLESLFRCEPRGHPVIVCDNGSDDGSVERLRDWASGREVPVASGSLRELTTPPVPKPIRCVEFDRATAERGGEGSGDDAQLVLIRTGGNLGFAAGSNVGLRYALARGDLDLIWLLNNDTVVRPDALRHLLETVQADPLIGICGSTILHYDAPDRVQALAGGSYQPSLALTRMLGASLPAAMASSERVDGRLAYVTGASMLLTRSFLQEVGLMNEEYFLYFEELDWAVRARDRFRLGYAPASIVYHKEGRSIGTRGARHKSETADFYFIRNRLRFTRRYYPDEMRTVRLALLVAMARRLARGQWRRVRMIARLLREQ